MTVYERKDLPERLHYSKAGHRLGDIIVIPDIEGNVFSSVGKKTKFSSDDQSDLFRFLFDLREKH